MESELDFGLVGHEEQPSGMGSLQLGVLRYALFVQKQTSGHLKWREALALPWVGMEGDGRLMRDFQKMAARQGISLAPAVQCSSFPAVAKALSECGGFALLPEAAKQDSLMSIKAPFLKALDRNIRLVWSERRLAVRGELGLWREMLRAGLAW